MERLRLDVLADAHSSSSFCILRASSKRGVILWVALGDEDTLPCSLSDGK